MVFDRVAAIILRQYYLLRGSFSRVLPLFIWVAIDIVLWGFLTRYLNSVSGSRIDFVPMMLGAVLLWDFFIRIMQGVTMAFFEDVWSRNFLNIFATPIRISEYVLGLVASSVLTSSIGVLMMLGLSTTVFGLSFFTYGLMLVPFILVLFLFGIALGILGCSAVMRFGPSAEWFIWPIPAMIAPFAAVFYPVSTLPGWMQAVSHLVAPSYVFEGMRMFLAGKVVPWQMLATGSALALAYVFLAGLVFKSTYLHAVRTGLIARYSAENLG
ncbi:MAG: ABC transporter permease [Candidatus Omnitrophica bacterium]|nr:ABC transporter permease [Candidatus Omnitrophota bacterium]